MYNPQSATLIPCVGNPNGQLAGSAAGARGTNSAPDVAWDTQNLWVCTTTGNTTAAVWSPLTSTNIQTVVKNLGTVTTGTATFNRQVGPVQQIVVGGPLTIALSGWTPNVGAVNSYSEIMVEMTNGGSQTLTWPNTINWVTPGTGAVTQSFATYGVTLQTAGTDFIVFWSPDGGANVFGKIVR
jgi:hypothetical protein